MTNLLFGLIREGYILLIYPSDIANDTMLIRLQKGDQVEVRAFRPTHFVYGNIDPDFLLRENIEAMMMEFKNEEAK